MRTFQEIYKEWAFEKKHYVKKSTLSVYKLLVENHLLPEFYDDTVINERKLQNFVLNKLDDGLSQKTVKDILIVLHMIGKYGKKHFGMDYQKSEINYPTIHKKNEVEIMSVKNQKKLMSYIKEHFDFRALGIYMCLSTGMRIGEVCALIWDNIDINEIPRIKTHWSIRQRNKTN